MLHTASGFGRTCQLRFDMMTLRVMCTHDLEILLVKYLQARLQP